VEIISEELTNIAGSLSDKLLSQVEGVSSSEIEAFKMEIEGITNALQDLAESPEHLDELRVLADEAMVEHTSNLNPLAQKTIMHIWEIKSEEIISKIREKFPEIEQESDVEAESEAEIEPEVETEPEVEIEPEVVLEFESTPEPQVESTPIIETTFEELNLNIINERMSFAKLYRERQSILSEYNSFFKLKMTLQTVENTLMAGLTDGLRGGRTAYGLIENFDELLAIRLPSSFNEILDDVKSGETFEFNAMLSDYNIARKLFIFDGTQF